MKRLPLPTILVGGGDGGAAAAEEDNDFSFKQSEESIQKTYGFKNGILQVLEN